MRKILICCLVIAVLILFAVLLFRIFRDMFGTCENIREKMKGGRFVRAVGIGQPCRNIQISGNRKEFYMNLTQIYVRKNDEREIFFIICGDVFEIVENNEIGRNVLDENGKPVKAVFVISFNNINNYNFEFLPDIPQHYEARGMRNMVNFMLKNETRQTFLQTYAERLNDLFMNLTNENFNYIFNDNAELNINLISLTESYNETLNEIFNYLLENDNFHFIVKPQQLTEENEIFRNFVFSNIAFPVLEKGEDNESVRDSFAYISDKIDIKNAFLNFVSYGGALIKITIVPQLRAKHFKTLTGRDLSELKNPKISIRKHWQKHINTRIRRKRREFSMIHKSAFYLSNEAGLIPYFIWLNSDTGNEFKDVHMADIFPNNLALSCLTYGKLPK